MGASTVSEEVPKVVKDSLDVDVVEVVEDSGKVVNGDSVPSNEAWAVVEDSVDVLVAMGDLLQSKEAFAVVEDSFDGKDVVEVVEDSLDRDIDVARYDKHERSAIRNFDLNNLPDDVTEATSGDHVNSDAGQCASVNKFDLNKFPDNWSEEDGAAESERKKVIRSMLKIYLNGFY